MSPFDRAHMTAIDVSIVTMALSHVVFEIFSVEKCDLEIGSKVTQGFLLLSCSNFVRKVHRFWDILLQKCQRPWKPG